MTRPRDRHGRPLPAGSRDRLRAEQAPSSVAEALRQGILLFNRQRFFEAHECFEYAWKAPAADEADRRFWKGLAQIAVGCCHIQRGNPVGAVALLARGVEQLRDYPSSHHGIDTRALSAGARLLAREVRHDGISAGMEFPRLPDQNT